MAFVLLSFQPFVDASYHGEEGFIGVHESLVVKKQEKVLCLS